MARPVKNSADYFSHDCGMRNDSRLKAVRRKFGHTGYSVWNMLLEHLTNSDFFEVEYSELSIELMAGDFEIEPERLKEIIGYLQVLGLIVVEEGKLFSTGLKKRLQQVIDKRTRSKKAYRNRMSQKVTGADVSVAEIIQIKEKETKVKETKAKKGIPKNGNAAAASFGFNNFFQTRWQEKYPSYQWQLADTATLSEIENFIRNRLKNKPGATIKSEAEKLIDRLPKWIQQDGYFELKFIAKKLNVLFNEIDSPKRGKARLPPNWQQDQDIIKTLKGGVLTPSYDDQGRIRRISKGN